MRTLRMRQEIRGLLKFPLVARIGMTRLIRSAGAQPSGEIMWKSERVFIGEARHSSRLNSWHVSSEMGPPPPTPHKGEASRPAARCCARDTQP